jgi:ATP-dependent Lon protease
MPSSPDTPELNPSPSHSDSSEPKPVLRLIPLQDTVVFPNMGITLTEEVGDDERVVLVPRHENEFLEVGTVAEVTEQLRLPGGGHAVALSGEHRALIGAAQTGPAGELRVEVQEHPDDVPADKRTRELEREYRATVEEILELRGDDGRIAAFLRAIAEPGALADSAGYSPNLSYEQKVQLLRALDVTDRLELAVKLQRESLAELQIRKRIREDVQEGAEKQQREYFLRKQMESIRKELGEDDASVADEYRTKIAEAQMPQAVEEQALKELGRLERMGEQTGESSMIRTYLDWLIAVPWSKRSEEHLDPVAAREVLDADHAGLEDVKDRVTEYLAVRKLRQDRGIEAEGRVGDRSGAILTLIGPPGTGKTSIGESIARATGREFVRMSLGGVRDEAEIRGHRRTYIGALPGRLVRALRDAGTMNPVILLDEVDKVGADWRGDPSAALLEVLDPAQNHSFRDHYLDVELDLSQVMFLATANVADTIPGPLLDRMEVIGFDGYTTEEKLAIARGYLWPRQRERNGLREDEVEISDDMLKTIVAEYTREAGVRNLERNLGTVLRKTATRIASSQTARAASGKRNGDGGAPSEARAKPSKAGKTPPAVETPVQIDLDAVRDALGRQKFFQESAARTATPGVATGLAVTGTGGDVLFVEATAMHTGGQGKGANLVLTGQLGDVMKESAQIALSYVRGHAAELGIPEDAFAGREFHVHVPAGAIPKDGPSAGVTMVTALASLLSGRPVKHTVGMTGEVTLQGRVLPIGGLKQKALAAHAAGLTDVILPERNRGDLDEIPQEVREQMSFHPVMTIDEVLERALEPARASNPSAGTGAGRGGGKGSTARRKGKGAGGGAEAEDRDDADGDAPARDEVAGVTS